MFPNFPTEIWTFIAKFLTPKDLASLSQTCVSAFHQLTSDSLFWQVYTSQSRLSRPTNVSYANLYRRAQALNQCPTQISLTRIPSPLSHAHSTDICIVAAIADRLILTDANFIYIYPTGPNLQVSDFCKDQLSSTQDLVRRTVPFQNAIGFLESCSGDPPSESSEIRLKFRTFHFSTYDVQETILSAGKHGISSHITDITAIQHPRLIYSCGVDESYLVFFVDHASELRVVERATSLCIKKLKVHQPNTFLRLVRRSAGWISDGFVVAGIVEGNLDTPEPDICLWIPDKLGHKNHRIPLQHGWRLVDVVMSKCGTLAWRVSDGVKLLLWRSWQPFNPEVSPVPWPTTVLLTSDSSLNKASTEFMITEDGRHLFLLPRGVRPDDSVSIDGRIMRTTFAGHAVQSQECIRRDVSLDTSIWTWATACAGGRFVICASLGSGYFSGFDLRNGERMWSFTCAEAMKEVVLVGEHYLAAIGISGAVHVWHFGKYCKHVHGRRTFGKFELGRYPPLLEDDG